MRAVRLAPALVLVRVVEPVRGVVLGGALAHVLSCAAGIVMGLAPAGVIRGVPQRARVHAN